MPFYPTKSSQNKKSLKNQVLFLYYAKVSPPIRCNKHCSITMLTEHIYQLSMPLTYGYLVIEIVKPSVGFFLFIKKKQPPCLFIAIFGYKLYEDIIYTLSHDDIYIISRFIRIINRIS